MDLKEIKNVIELMTKNGLSEFELEKPDFKIRVKKGGPGESGTTILTQAPIHPILTTVAGGSASAGAAQAAASTPAVPASDSKDIVSPMVGTFYRSPSPESGPYIEIGQEVGPETVVCIIEAMKVMNEIKSEIKGVITDVLAENGKPVEFGKPLFRVRPL
jgi:acetyl-CoA carboxylase biotin carboxyl carrier protein